MFLNTHIYICIYNYIYIYIHVYIHTCTVYIYILWLYMCVCVCLCGDITSIYLMYNCESGLLTCKEMKNMWSPAMGEVNLMRSQVVFHMFFFWTQMGSLIQLIHWKLERIGWGLKQTQTIQTLQNWGEHIIYRKPCPRSEQFKRAKVSYISSPFTPSPTPQPLGRQDGECGTGKTFCQPSQCSWAVLTGKGWKLLARSHGGEKCGCDWNISVGFHGMLMR